MSGVDEILGQLPIDQIASQLGEDPQAVRQAADVAVPAILGGLSANASDSGGAASLLDALTQHPESLLDGGIDLSQINVADGEKAASHIFGANQDQVINQLGGVGGGSTLVKKLLPILIPIILSFVAKRMGGQGAAPTSGAGQDVLSSVLQQVLTGALQGAGGGSAAPSAGNILGDLLGGLLGGGRKA